MRIHLLPQKPHYYKANLHMHTVLSDGDMTPEETKRAYMAHGYSVVAFTDHEVMIPHPELTDENFLALTSYETAIAAEDYRDTDFSFQKTTHLNLYAPENSLRIPPVFDERTIWPGIGHIRAYVDDEMRKVVFAHTPDCVNRLIAAANEAGYLVSYNHPVWSCQSYPDYAGLEGVWGVEWYNTGCVIAGYPDTIQPVDDFLRAGKRVFPLATDDAHHLKDCFGGWVMIGADKLTHADIFAALKQGDFYSSTGPEITEISLEGDILRVACSPAASVLVTTERRFARQAYAQNGVPVTAAEFDLGDYFRFEAKENSYFRVTVLDGAGRTAYSRAFFADEWGF